MLYIITATDKKGLIGVNNKLPWRVASELQFFQSTTLGQTVVMGRKTHESIGGNLINRKNIVFSSSDKSVNVESVLALAKKDEVFIIGGATIYSLFLPHADYIIKSVIEGEYSGDTYFPDYPQDDFELFDSRLFNNAGEPAYEVQFYKRKRGE